MVSQKFTFCIVFTNKNIVDVYIQLPPPPANIGLKKTPSEVGLNALRLITSSIDICAIKDGRSDGRINSSPYSPCSS